MNKTSFKFRFIRSLLLGLLVALLVTACDKKEDSHEDIVSADLLVIIDSLGSPCDEVIEYESTSELEYSISCKTGHRYLISVNPQGRVDIQNTE